MELSDHGSSAMDMIYRGTRLQYLSGPYDMLYRVQLFVN
jgi:hypothetical protein